jgi:hypothetical protein
VYVVTQSYDGPDHQGSLVAITAGGAFAWTASFTLDVGTVSGDLLPAVGGDGTVYVPTFDGLMAFTADGVLGWQVGLDGTPGPAAISASGSTVYALTSGSLYAIEASGSVLWRIPASQPFGNYARTAFVDGRGVVYVPTNDPKTGSLTTAAVDPQGNVLWTMPGAGQPAAMAADGTIYAEGPNLGGVAMYGVLTALGPLAP